MDIVKESVFEFFTGQGVATETKTPIVAPGYSPQLIYKGIKIRCVTGTIYVSPEGTPAGEGFSLTAGQEVTIHVDQPSRIYIDGDGEFEWCAE